VWVARFIGLPFIHRLILRILLYQILVDRAVDVIVMNFVAMDMVVTGFFNGVGCHPTIPESCSRMQVTCTGEHLNNMRPLNIRAFKRTNLSYNLYILTLEKTSSSLVYCYNN
jgi:hypothetical protein